VWPALNVSSQVGRGRRLQIGESSRADSPAVLTQHGGRPDASEGRKRPLRDRICEPWPRRLKNVYYLLLGRRVPSMLQRLRRDGGGFLLFNEIRVHDRKPRRWPWSVPKDCFRPNDDLGPRVAFLFITQGSRARGESRLPCSPC